MDADEVLRALLAETDSPLKLAEAELRSAQEKIDKIKAERYGLELALARRQGNPEPPAPTREVTDPITVTPAPHAPDWGGLARTEAALRVLAIAGRSMHRKEILLEIHRRGRNDTLDDLSAALAYLNRTHRVVSLGKGVWASPDVLPPATNGHVLVPVQTTEEESR